MKIEVNIDENGQTYLPVIVRKQGFEGKVEVFLTRDALVYLRPHATHEDVLRALQYATSLLLEVDHPVVTDQKV